MSPKIKVISMPCNQALLLIICLLVSPSYLKGKSRPIDYQDKESRVYFNNNWKGIRSEDNTQFPLPLASVDINGLFPPKNNFSSILQSTSVKAFTFVVFFIFHVNLFRSLKKSYYDFVKRLKGKFPLTQALSSYRISSTFHYKCQTESTYPSNDDKATNQEGKMETLPFVLLFSIENAEIKTFLSNCFNGGFTNLFAEDSLDAFYLATKHLPDLIISDLNTSELSGMALCKNLKQTEYTAHIPFIFITYLNSMNLVTEALNYGAEDFILYPVDRECLFLKVRNLLLLKQRVMSKYSGKKYLKAEEISENNNDQQFLNRILGIVNLNMMNASFTIDNFSKELGMSRTQMYRKIKSLTGLSPNEFIRNQRIQRAGQLLQKSDLTISEITYEVGFTDVRYFRRCFKEYFKVNPSEYANGGNDK
jgi:AraC-like DNA-binding protein